MAVIAGNWKLNKTPNEACAFFSELDLEGLDGEHEVIVFPSSLALASAVSCRDRDPRVRLGAQNIYWEASGAFTGETSAEHASAVGADFVLIGHSERRHVFGESDDDTARKVTAARRAGLIPVLCLGETLDERKAGRVDEVILRQLDAALAPLSEGEGRFMLAYEPVWAIGTGETATASDASAAHATLRARLSAQLGAEVASHVPILYGGSVKPANAAELLAAPDVDGVLVGGASLDASSFSQIAARAG